MQRKIYIHGAVMLIMAVILSLFDVVLIATRLWQNVLLGAAQRGQPDQIALGASDQIIGIFALVYLVLLFAFVVTNASWGYKMVKEFKEKGQAEFFMTPGQVAWSWFIPILNLVRPFYLCSAMIRYSENPSIDKKAQKQMVPVVMVWWAIWFGGWLFGKTVARADIDFNAPDAIVQVINLNQMIALSSVLEIVAMIACMKTVVTILRNWANYTGGQAVVPAYSTAS